MSRYFPDETMYFNQKKVIERFEDDDSKGGEYRKVYWENMPFKQGDIVKHRKYGYCYVWKIMSRGPYEGQLDLATINYMRRAANGGMWAGQKLRGELNEVDEVKFKNIEEQGKWLQLNVEPSGWVEPTDEWIKAGKHKKGVA